MPGGLFLLSFTLNLPREKVSFGTCPEDAFQLGLTAFQGVPRLLRTQKKLRIFSDYQAKIPDRSR